VGQAQKPYHDLGLSTVNSGSLRRDVQDGAILADTPCENLMDSVRCLSGRVKEEISLKKTYGIRVVMLTTGFPCENPSNGLFNLRAAKALSRYVNLKVIHLRSWKPGRASIQYSTLEGLPVITITAPQIPSWDLCNLALYRRIGWHKVHALIQGCDLIHSVDPIFSGELASSWGRLVNIHHVTQVIATIDATLIRRRKYGSIVGVKRHIHGVACNSRLLAKQISEYFPQTPNVRTVYRGVDLIEYRPCGPIAGPFKHRTPVRFLYLGGFAPYPRLPYGSNTKGGETLLAAWLEAEENLVSKGASLLIAGDQSNCSQVARWITSLRYPRRVHVAGELHPDIVPSYIRASDVVLVPSMEEGLPNVAMEASACGRPVFGSSVGGIPEVVVNGETGLLLPAGDVAAWKNALIAYAIKIDELKIMGASARQRMEALFDSNEFSTKMLDLYAAALSEPIDANHL
jgi:glycosyltransferase involved in cell wall biosynthesis